MGEMTESNIQHFRLEERAMEGNLKTQLRWLSKLNIELEIEKLERFWHSLGSLLMDLFRHKHIVKVFSNVLYFFINF